MIDAQRILKPEQFENGIASGRRISWWRRVDSVILWAMKLFLFALLSVPLSVLAEGGLPAQPYIYVEGKAEIEKPADMVTLRFDLVTHNADQAKANQEVQTKAAKIFALLNDKKIAEKDVIGGDLRSEAEYEENEDSSRNRGKLIGYKVTRPFTVKVRDVATFAKIVDELLAIAGTEFSGIEAGLSNEKELQDQVWEKALANAREKAEKTVKGAGMKIDSVFAISPVAFPQISHRILGVIRKFMRWRLGLIKLTRRNTGLRLFRSARVST
jgi:uncharacterized protein YggE